MPGYNNPYYGPTYPGINYGYSSTPAMPMQSYAAQPTVAAAWVEGEIEARGRQMPAGATQFFMIDANRQKIYLKSLNQMGMPNPMQTLSFTIDDQPQGNLSAGQSGAMSYSNGPDMSQYVTRQDFDQLRNELRQMTQSGTGSGNANMSGQNGNSGNQNGGNRGGNR